MPGSAAKVVISERQQEVLRQLSTATTAAKRLTQRAAIVLLAFAGLDNEAIAPRVGLERHQVGRWRRRWQQAFPKRVTLECLETAATLRRAIEEVLRDEPRPGCPGTLESIGNQEKEEAGRGVAASRDGSALRHPRMKLNNPVTVSMTRSLKPSLILRKIAETM